MIDILPEQIEFGTAKEGENVEAKEHMATDSQMSSWCCQNFLKDLSLGQRRWRYGDSNLTSRRKM